MEQHYFVEQSKKPTYKYCIVPKCRNTIRNAPDKVFFLVPRGANIRIKWCKIMKRDMVSPSTCLYCCEDHFDIEEDTDNFMEYKIMNLQEKQKTKLRLKRGILPHKFKCQEDTESESQPVRKAFLKRIHLEAESTDDALAPVEYYIPTATLIDYVCGACGNRIVGFRYACVQCADYDQCAECEASGAHAEHYVLRVPRVERATEHQQTVLDRFRRELKQVNIPVKPKLERDDSEEESIVVKEEIVEPEELDPLQCAGAGAVKQEVIDPEYSDATACGQVPARPSEASSTRARPATASSRAREAKASGCSAAASRPADTGPEAVEQCAGPGPGGGAVKQETIDSDDDLLTLDRFQFTEATGVPLRAYEASNVQARAGASRGRAEDSKRQAGASRDLNLSELSTKFDSMRVPRKRRKTEELGD